MKGLDKLASASQLRVAGLMSGTSADGVDAAVVDVPRRGAVKLLAFDTVRYPPSVRRAVLALCAADAGDVAEVCHLNAVLGELFARAVTRLAERAGVPLASIDLIGSHGQTIRHLPRGRRFGGRAIGSTLQIGAPAVIAERTGITTVADFRPRDLAAGGQGAPLVPYADYVLFAHRRRSRAVQNIGGIANVTFLPAGGSLDEVVAFDTGPGNMIIDRLAERVTGGKHAYDRGGRLAAAGAVNATLLAELMRHPYLRRRPPKSTGREQFGWAFADGLADRAAKRGLPPADLLATATAFTAAAIADAYRRFAPGPIDEVLLCGGGAHNRTLVAMLTDRLRPAAVTSTDTLGIPADAKEAVAFAILAAATLRGTPANVPAATGAARPVLLGSITPAGHRPAPARKPKGGKRRS